MNRWHVITFIVACHLLSACGITLGRVGGETEVDPFDDPIPLPSPSPTPPPDGMTGLQAFQLTYHAWLRSKVCASCHLTGGLMGTHPFADPNAAVAYNFIKQNGYVDFSTPSQSVMVLKIPNHLSPICAEPQCSTWTAEMATQIQAWWDMGESP